MKTGLILYGAPATGKDTVTAELVDLEHRFQHFRRLKCGPGRILGYRMIDPEHADALRREPGAILWENSRYGATYFVDRAGLDQLWGEGYVPVVHLGQVEAVEAIRDFSDTDTRWAVVELYCQPAILRSRIESRGTGDDAQRLTAVDQTLRLPRADIRIDTEVTSATDAAMLISEHMRLAATFRSFVPL